MKIIAGLYKSRTIRAPKGLITRPTSSRLREAVFNICQQQKEMRFLDLFSGSGAMGFEALSRGALSATFVDNSRESIRCIYENIRLLDVASQTEVIHGNVFEVLAKLAKRGCCYTLIYADPPYGASYSQAILALIDKILDIYPSFLNPGGTLFLEDVISKLPEKESLKHLILENSRCLGRSTLQQYRSL